MKKNISNLPVYLWASNPYILDLTKSKSESTITEIAPADAPAIALVIISGIAGKYSWIWCFTSP